jgi:ATP-dependent Clp protease ATP-binding subunit ClpC
MFERFTAESRRAVVHAQEEARRLGHDHVGSEHILLGLMSDDEGLACRALAAAGVTLLAARQRVSEAAGTGAAGGTGASGHEAAGAETATRPDPAAPLPFTPHAKKVLERSLREALHLSSGSIDTEHILLGLLGEFDGTVSAVLASLGVSPYDVRWRLLGEIRSAGGVSPDEIRWTTAADRPRTPAPTRVVRIGADAVAGLRAQLESIDRRLAATEAHLARIQAHLGIEIPPEREPDGGAEDSPAQEA